MLDKLKGWVYDHKEELSVYGMCAVYLIFCAALGLGIAKWQARIWAKALAAAII